MKFLKTTIAVAVGSVVALSAHAQSSPTLDRIRSTGTITIAYRDASIPFSYLDDKAKPVGFGWEIANKVAENVKKELGLANITIKPQPVTSANRMPLVINGTVDIECGSTTNNATRAKDVDFSVNYFYTGTRLIVRSNSGIHSLADLRGKTLVSTLGTTPLQLLRTLNAEQNLGINITTAKDHDASFLNVQQGLADAFGMDEILIAGLRAAAAKPADYAIVGDALHVEPYACMVRKGDAAFKAIVDKTIIQLMDSGEFTKMYDRWFTQPIPPKGITLGLPMPAELKANLTAHSDAPAD